MVAEVVLVIGAEKEDGEDDEGSVPAEEFSGKEGLEEFCEEEAVVEDARFAGVGVEDVSFFELDFEGEGLGGWGVDGAGGVFDAEGGYFRGEFVGAFGCVLCEEVGECVNGE